MTNRVKDEVFMWSSSHNLCQTDVHSWLHTVSTEICKRYWNSKTGSLSLCEGSVKNTVRLSKPRLDQKSSQRGITSACFHLIKTRKTTEWLHKEDKDNQKDTQEKIFTAPIQLSSKRPTHRKVKWDLSEVEENKSAAWLLENMLPQDKWEASEQFITTGSDAFAFRYR